MSEISSGRRRSQQRTRFDDSGRRTVIYAVIGVLVLLLLVGGAIIYGSQHADFALTLQLGGISRAKDDLPRNFRLWAVQPDGRLRYATAFFPPRSNAPASEVDTVAGPLVDHAEDMEQVYYFGALNITSKVQNGANNDSSRFYKLFWVEHDPSVAAYGIDMTTKSPPYIAVDSADKAGKKKFIAMGAPQQAYYSQVIVAVALPPGATVSDVAYKLALPGDTPNTEALLAPYRRAAINGWTVYYFDQTALTAPMTVRILYTPPSDPTKPAPELNLWETDRQR